ncbi:MAG: hypothetical protein US60_C0002G0019 [Microgenomates group bacterium GW2011_GWC1_37_8]|uniref:Transposase IS200-like domain-containing protein n=1 Tax=Candidatus Woesebacteria bacterium GW2011_GWB1_38_8 TaxID=1618570 RepID=A0A0G0L362_9BACT|nr:MAG: hypothetical protein US60_C0002G0019 [Microgenomates group bacterium GW2011_GWC1_37_8]KKQ85457.1 MAG: hypothetical protein UT08_C0006G0040 [Candidatus Woesebacteria bacterium GW2011_GWB1_38_8]
MSGKRKVVFAEGEVYHVFNRATANEQIFVKKKDLERALDLFSFYRFKQSLRFSFFKRLTDQEKDEHIKNLSNKAPIVDIYAYSLMPNHFHLLLRENSSKGVQTFLSNFQNSFAKFFNIKNNRFGTLFQRPFKAKHIDTDGELLHVSRYIHLNPVTAYIIEYDELKGSNLSSLPSYLDKKETFISNEFLIKLVGSAARYERFVANQIDYQRKLAKIRHLLLD